MKQDYYTTPKAGRIMRALWKAAGADRYILERGTYPDHVKYACLGGIVLATGFMAAMAGGYAFYVIFEPKGDIISKSVEAADLPTTILAITFGLIWGLIIFNIDRFIVASTGKGDGTEAITWGEIKGAIPRILMGMIIAITISKPIEIRMFKSEIDVALHSAVQDKEREGTKEAEKINRPYIEEYQARIADCKKEIADKQEAHRIAELNYTLEMDGHGGTKNQGIGPVAKNKKAISDRVLLELTDLREVKNKEIETLQINLLAADNKLKKDIHDATKKAHGLDGLLERIKLAHKEAGWEISLFITLLFMAIELTPIFFKMMLIKSPYDFMSDNIKSLIKAEQGIEIKYDFYEDKQGVQRDLVVNHQADRLLQEKIKLIQTQTELSELVMENWKTKETKNIKDNPGSYIEKKS